MRTTSNRRIEIKAVARPPPGTRSNTLEESWPRWRPTATTVKMILR